MKYSTIELYGDVDPVVIETRKSTSRHLIEKAKKKIAKLQEVDAKERDETLISAIVNAIEWNEMIINEEI